jgi:hypothetical protein
VQEGLVAIVKGLPDADQAHFFEILRAKATLRKDEECYAMKTIYQGSDALPPPMKARFLRAFLVASVREIPTP